MGASTQIMKVAPGVPEPAAIGLATVGAGLQTAGALAICIDFYTGPLSAASVVFYGVASHMVWSKAGTGDLFWMEKRSSSKGNPGGFQSVEHLRFGPFIYMAGY